MNDPYVPTSDCGGHAPFPHRGLSLTRREAVAVAGAAMIGPYLLSCARSGSTASPLAEPLYYSSATALANAIRAKTVSSEEVMRAFVTRASEVNPKINAVVLLLADEAVATARRADQAVARGERLGPLHGVPMTIKDSIETADAVTTAGTMGRARFVPTNDATVVARLRAAGAILMGKTNTPELTAKNHTDNLVFGRSNNPYDLGRSPGGSSGGAAAILAAGGSAFDVGSDAGGSIRYPSHCCGTAGLKPTFGRVPRTGHVPPTGGLTDAFVHVGPMARYVDDLALLLPIIAGEDFRDPSVMPSPSDALRGVDVRGLRISFHCDNGILSPTAETQATVRNAAASLAKAGAIVEEMRPPGIEETSPIIYALWAADGGAYFRNALQTAGTTEHTLDWLAQAKPTPMQDFTKLVDQWDRFRSRMIGFLEKYDIILCPVNAEPAIPHTGFADFHPRFSYAHTFNLTGWPVVVVRAGTSAEGLPIGVQVVARPWRDDVAISVAQYLESVGGGFRPPREL